MTKGNNMIDFEVFDIAYQSSCSFATEQEARDWVEKVIDIDPSYAKNDFIIYKRERLD